MGIGQIAENCWPEHQMAEISNGGKSNGGISFVRKKCSTENY